MRTREREESMLYSALALVSVLHANKKMSLSVQCSMCYPYGCLQVGDPNSEKKLRGEGGEYNCTW